MHNLKDIFCNQIKHCPVLLACSFRIFYWLKAFLNTRLEFLVLTAFPIASFAHPQTPAKCK